MILTSNYNHHQLMGGGEFDSAPQLSSENEEQDRPYFPHEYEALYRSWDDQSPNSCDDNTAARLIEA